jgi:hypothetical protein
MKNIAPRRALQATANTRPKASVREPAEKPGRRRQEILLRIGVLIPLVLLVITLARGTNVRKTLPDYLLGTWQSSSPEYADCYMEITPARLVFGNAENGYTLYFVSQFEQISEGGQNTIVVHYTDLDERAYEMSVVYTRYPEEHIQFKHKPSVVWERRPDS